MRHLFTAALLVVATATPVLANQADLGRMVNDVQAEAAWHGVEVRKIVRQGNTLLVNGIDRSGRAVTLRESCLNSRIDCLPDGVAGGVSPHLRAPD
jgi:hypothetical protein